MSTPKTDLVDESTDPAGSELEPQDLVRSSDAQAANDAQAQLHRGELMMPPPRAGTPIRASSVDALEALLPPAPTMPGLGQPQAPKWRGVRSKSLPVKHIQSMTRAARALYREILDAAMGQAKTVLESKAHRE
jgi:hypothetical protein